MVEKWHVLGLAERAVRLQDAVARFSECAWGDQRSVLFNALNMLISLRMADGAIAEPVEQDAAASDKDASSRSDTAPSDLSALGRELARIAKEYEPDMLEEEAAESASDSGLEDDIELTEARARRARTAPGHVSDASPGRAPTSTEAAAMLDYRTFTRRQYLSRHCAEWDEEAFVYECLYKLLSGKSCIDWVWEEQGLELPSRVQVSRKAMLALLTRVWLASAKLSDIRTMLSRQMHPVVHEFAATAHRLALQLDSALAAVLETVSTDKLSLIGFANTVMPLTLPLQAVHDELTKAGFFTDEDGRIASAMVAVETLSSQPYRYRHAVALLAEALMHSVVEEANRILQLPGSTIPEGSEIGVLASASKALWHAAAQFEPALALLYVQRHGMLSFDCCSGDVLGFCQWAQHTAASLRAFAGQERMRGRVNAGLKDQLQLIQSIYLFPHRLEGMEGVVRAIGMPDMQGPGRASVLEMLRSRVPELRFVQSEAYVRCVLPESSRTAGMDRIVSVYSRVSHIIACCQVMLARLDRMSIERGEAKRWHLGRALNSRTFVHTVLACVQGVVCAEHAARLAALLSRESATQHEFERELEREAAMLGRELVYPFLDRGLLEHLRGLARGMAKWTQEAPREEPNVHIEGFLAQLEQLASGEGGAALEVLRERLEMMNSG